MEERDGRRTNKVEGASTDTTDMRAYADSRWLAYAPPLPVPDVPNQPPVGQEAVEALDESQASTFIGAEPPQWPAGSIEQAICAYPWECATAVAIARCESALRPDAVGDGSYGLFQIQASAHAWKWADFWQAWSDPVRNAEYAWEIYQGRGWYAWSCF